MPSPDEPLGPEFDKSKFRAIMADIASYRMPFGKYGPGNYPPKGVPIYDLPPEYLHWFKSKGFPKGKLGMLLEIVYEAKINGADAIFQDLRFRAGGRTQLRKPNRRDKIVFEDDDGDEA